MILFESLGFPDPIPPSEHSVQTTSRPIQQLLSVDYTVYMMTVANMHNGSGVLRSLQDGIMRSFSRHDFLVIVEVALPRLLNIRGANRD